MKQKYEFKSIVAETLLTKEPDSERQGCGESGGESGIRLFPLRRGEVERSRLRGAWVVFRPCRAPVY